jgi:hypothetical protein
VIDAKLKAKATPKPMTNTEIGLEVFNTTNPTNAANLVGRTLRRPEVRNEIEKRMAAQNIFVDKHLKNIDKLAFSAKSDDTKLRASQDLADRSGAHYKYVAEENRNKNLEEAISDADFAMIVGKYKNKGDNEEKNSKGSEASFR